MADRASYHLKNDQNKLSLWYKDLELQLCSSKRPLPHLKLRIISVLHAPADLQHSSMTLRTFLVRCHSLSHSGLHKDVIILLDFGRVTPSSPQMGTGKDVQEGREVHIWEPWHSLDIATTCIIPMESISESVGDQMCPRAVHTTVIFCTRFWIVPS